MVISMMKDATSFESVMEQYSAEIYRYLWRMFGDSQEAEDCLQDSFLRAYKAYGRLKPDSNVRAWLYTIATNTARTQLKQRGRRWRQEGGLVAEMQSGQAAIESGILQREELEAIHEAVQGLPLKQRAALMMRKYQELDYGEIAEALKCSPESARANVYQGLRKLRTSFASR